jgi:hypothetical protein
MSLTSNERIMNSKSRFVRISSEDKSIGTNNRFTVDLQSNGGIIDNVKGFIVHSAQVPNVFNNVASYNNNYIISFPGPSTETELNLNVPVGYYLIDDLINVINGQIQLQAALNGDAYTLVLSKVGIFPNEKIQFLGNGFSAGACVLFSSDNSIYPNLGVETTTDGIPPNIPFTIVNATPIIAQNIPNLIGETEVYIHSRTLAPNNLSEASGTFSVVDKINLDEPFGSMCYQDYENDMTHQVRYFPYESKKTLRTVDINLRNRTGQLLTLPSNFGFTMMIKIFYK